MRPRTAADPARSHHPTDGPGAGAGNPCPRTWASLTKTADTATRSCSTCQNVVRDVTTLTRRQALALVEQRAAGRPVCVYVQFDAGGDVITKETRGARAAGTPWRWLRSLPARLVALVLAAVTWHGCERSKPAVDPEAATVETRGLPPRVDGAETPAGEAARLRRGLGHLEMIGYVSNPH